MAGTYVLMLFCIAAAISNVFCSIGFVKWTFDRREGPEIIPNFQTASNFRADISPLGSDIDAILPPGRVKKCVFVDGKSFNLATHLESTCMQDIDQCSFGLFISFYLKVENWNDDINSVILRTTNAEQSDAGIYIGKAGDDILIYMRGASGKTFTRSFNQSEVYQKWSKIEIFFLRFLTVEVNDVAVEKKPTTALNLTTYSSAISSFIVGANNGPTFYLDEVFVSFLPGSPVAATTIASQSTKHAPTTSDSATKSAATTTTTEAASTTSRSIATVKKTDATKTTEGAETSTHTPKSTADIANIWIPILIALLAFLVVTCCLLWLLCLRRKHKSGEANLNSDDIPLAERNGGYAKASTVEPYRDEGSNHNTEDDQTDNEERGGRLLAD